MYLIACGCRVRGCAAKAVPKPQPPKEKSEFEKKIEAREKREAEEAERKAALRAQMQTAEGMDPEDMDNDRVRQRQMEMAADLDSAIDAFGISDAPRDAPKPKGKPAPPKQAPPPQAPSEEVRPDRLTAELNAAGSIEDFSPKTDGDFEKLGLKINQKLKAYEGTKGHMTTLKALLRAATDNLSVDDCKELSSITSVIANDKLKAEREKDKKGKGKKKGKLNLAASKATDMDDGDDYDW
jgi:translation initiation factor 3 subunit J